MFKRVFVLFLIYFASLSAFAQTEKYTAPVKWERYKVSSQNVSVLLPKMPVLVESSDVCSEQETKKYVAYADQIVYGFNIASKIQGKLPHACSVMKQFGTENFQNRLVLLKAELKEVSETSFKQNNLTVVKISGTNASYWLINDFENKRWFELWVTNGNEDKAEVKNFIKSIEINKNAQGIEIGKGSDRTLGDETEKINESENGETVALRIVSKPIARYTDAARKVQVQGTVKLRITFLANGGIGEIAIANTLPFGFTMQDYVASIHGLTEQAVAAAKKIAFIPPKKDGKAFTVVKTVEYRFSIY